MDKNVLLDVVNLKQHFRINRKTTIKAVDGVSFQIFEGEIFSVVGESGSGKTTLGRSIIRIYDANDGEVTFLDQKISGKLDAKHRTFLHKNMQMIFQDPMASLNPRKKVLDTVAFGLDVLNESGSDEERKQRVSEALESVGLFPEHMSRYPHMFSGGQRQRIGIARALIMKPKFIIADEIISALDVSIQAQVIQLMKKIQKEQNLTIMFIAHDLSMVRYISDRVAVMHLGHIVEMGSVDDVFNHPIHPYTKSLLSAIPQPDPRSERTRQRVFYQKENLDYSACEMMQVSSGHSVLADTELLKQWENNDYKQYLVDKSN